MSYNPTKQLANTIAIMATRRKNQDPKAVKIKKDLEECGLEEHAEQFKASEIYDIPREGINK